MVYISRKDIGFRHLPFVNNDMLHEFPFLLSDLEPGSWLG